MNKNRIILLRHGQSRWNLENRFTGWVDVALTDTGQEEARRAGDLLRAQNLYPVLAFTSLLKRAIHTLNLTLEACGRDWIEVEKAWQLNERHYGALSGLNKAHTAEKHGEEQVHIWRRSFDIAPPFMPDGHEYDVSKDPRYRAISSESLPRTESLKDTLARVQPFWKEVVSERLSALEGPLLIAAHGNSLRALLMHLFLVPAEEIMQFEIPTGNPLLIELNDRLQPVFAHYLDKDRARALPKNLPL